MYPVLEKSKIQKYDEWLEAARNDGAIALIDKDKNWTSFDVVAKCRNLTGIKKIGHTGTLDPLATGLLILCFGRATKSFEEFTNLGKSYNATIKLGATTKTDDAEADEENITDVRYISEKMIEDTVSSFIGKNEQVPPVYSAKKIDGKRAYKLARENNQELNLKPVTVEIFSIKIINISKPYIDVDVDCSKGTYIRSLAREIGAKLGCGAYLSDLRRTAIGDYLVENAVKIDDVRLFS